MDQTDIAILNELRQHARISNKLLAERVNLSPPAVLERVKKLRERGIISEFVTRVDTALLGYNLTVLMELKIERNLSSAHISRALAQIPEILEIHDAAGNCDYILKIVAKNNFPKRIARFLCLYYTINVKICQC